MNFSKFLRTPIFKEHVQWLLQFTISVLGSIDTALVDFFSQTLFYEEINLAFREDFLLCKAISL